MLNEEQKSSNSIKIAYICLCHMDPDFVARTAKTLVNENEDGFFIHVDRKSNVDLFKMACKEIKNVYFVEDTEKVFWGGYSAIVATMRTIKLALATNNYERFILLQGQDYPLFSSKIIHEFFEKHMEIEFCKAENISCTNNPKKNMKCRGYWMMDEKSHFLLKKIRNWLHRFNTWEIGYRSGKFRSRKVKWDIYHGWAQFAISRKCIDYILSVYENNRKYNYYMKHCFAVDELYFQTIIYNSDFQYRVSKDVMISRFGEKTMLNLTYFEYPDQVTVFTEKQDYYWLKDTGCLFVRKVNSDSSDLLDEIDKQMNDKI